ncbi:MULTISPECIES: aquaporin [Arthrobacter]|uniref:Aquaporin n=2 Tax=Arthrobacter TaxID=1663 RepID=A0ABU9KQG4_9MICC|nr:aquaporin [Arthrobacter sp. YJM1]MDP5228354.1 aquaporin [Arthrobacter sp. YJM1]
MTSVDAVSAGSPANSPAEPAVVAEPHVLLRGGAELLGAFLIILGGAGVVMFTNTNLAPFPGPVATGLATVAAMYALGRISGGHFNPVLTLASAVAGRLSWKDALVYLVGQVAGGFLAALVLLAVLSNVAGVDGSKIFRVVAAGYGDNSAFKVQLPGVLLVEIIGSIVLAAVYLAATRQGRGRGVAAAAVSVGLAVAVLGQFAQSLSNSQFNPARSLAMAVFAEPWAIQQEWLFWVAPLAGALLAGMVARLISLSSTPMAVVADESADDAVAENATATEAAVTAAPAEAAEAKEAATAEQRAAAEHEEAKGFFDGK